MLRMGNFFDYIFVRGIPLSFFFKDLLLRWTHFLHDYRCPIPYVVVIIPLTHKTVFLILPPRKRKFSSKEKMLNLANIILPVFIVILIGFFFGRARQIDMSAVVDIAIYIGLPALVFTSMLEKSIVLEDAIFGNEI